MNPEDSLSPSSRETDPDFTGEELIRDESVESQKTNPLYALFIVPLRGHSGRVVTLSPPTSAAGVRSLSWP